MYTYYACFNSKESRNWELNNPLRVIFKYHHEANSTSDGRALCRLFPNMLRRIRSQFFYVVPPFAVGYYVFQAVEAKHDQLVRKNPADYADDV
ncbi:Cytochrome b-c1 complex subunit 8 [Trinorchestia longiramus]|nr:Cytochrome b-c1 complex subunit 8 [Trinorchestia longiramus]